MERAPVNWTAIRIIAGDHKTKEEFVCSSCLEPCRKIYPLNSEPDKCINQKKRRKEQEP